MSRWEAIDDEGRVRRCAYPGGNAAPTANAVAIEVGGGSLVLISPPGGADAEEAFAELDGLGRVVAIVPPNGFHRAGVAGAEARYPEAPIFVDPRAADRVAQKCRDRGRVRPLAELTPRLPAGVEIFVPPHLKRADTWARVDTSAGTVWYFTDLVINIDRLPGGLLGLVCRCLGFRTGLAVNRFGGRVMLVRDRPALSAWLCAELERRPAAAVVTGHGPAVRDAAQLQGFAELVARGLA